MSGSLRLPLGKSRVTLLLPTFPVEVTVSERFDGVANQDLPVDFCDHDEKSSFGTQSRAKTIVRTIQKADTAIRCSSIDLVCTEAGGRPNSIERVVICIRATSDQDERMDRDRQRCSSVPLLHTSMILFATERTTTIATCYSLGASLVRC